MPPASPMQQDSALVDAPVASSSSSRKVAVRSSAAACHAARAAGDAASFASIRTDAPATPGAGADDGIAASFATFTIAYPACARNRLIQPGVPVARDATEFAPRTVRIETDVGARARVRRLSRCTRRCRSGTSPAFLRPLRPSPARPSAAKACLGGRRSPCRSRHVKRARRKARKSHVETETHRHKIGRLLGLAREQDARIAAKGSGRSRPTDPIRAQQAPCRLVRVRRRLRRRR